MKADGQTFADLTTFLKEKYKAILTAVYCETTRLYDFYDPNVRKRGQIKNSPSLRSV